MPDESHTAANPEPSHSSVHLPKALWASIISLAIIAVVIVLLRWPNSRPPVPDVSEIRAMEATFYDPGAGSKVTFQVPASHWPSILSSLLPAKQDSAPAKWVSLGELKIELNGGGSFFIWLYNLEETPGAFSSGPTWEKRTYYRGGSTAQLESALVEAAEEAAEKESD